MFAIAVDNSNFPTGGAKPIGALDMSIKEMDQYEFNDSNYVASVILMSISGAFAIVLMVLVYKMADLKGKIKRGQALLGDSCQGANMRSNSIE